MSEEKVLTREIAEQLLKEKEPLRFEDYTALDDDAAEILATHKGELILDGLKEISDESATSLTNYQHEDNALHLNGISKLFHSVAESLGKYNGKLIHLNSLVELTDITAASLSNFRGELSLTGLTELSESTAASLAKHKGLLKLDGLTELSETVAENLVNHQGELSLNRLAELSESVAESLAKYKGETLPLNALTKLSDVAAANLSKYGGELLLNGLTEISDSVASSLANHKGKLSLNGLVELKDQQAKILSKHTGELILDSVTELDAFYFEIKNYQRISPTGSDGEVLSSNDDGAVFTDEADFIFQGVKVHIMWKEDENGQRAYINHKQTLEEIDDEFLNLFCPIVYDAFMDGVVDGVINLAVDWDCYLSDGQLGRIVKPLFQFIEKNENANKDENDPILALNQELEIALNKKDKHKSGESKLSTDEFRALLNQIVDLKDQIETLSCPEQSRINSMLKQIDGNK
jgi:hypothetical protein